MSPHEEELVTHGWHQVGAGHWMHPGILAGQQRFTTEEAIAHEAKAAVAESKEPVSLVAEKEDWQEEMRSELGKLRGEAERLDGLLQQYQKDFTDVAKILIPEVVAEGKGFTTESLLDAARKAVEMLPLAIQLRSHAQLDEESVKRIKEFVNETKKCGGWQKPVFVSVVDEECAGCKKLRGEVDAALAGWKGANEETDQHKAKLREVVVERDRLRGEMERLTKWQQHKRDTCNCPDYHCHTEGAARRIVEEYRIGRRYGDGVSFEEAVRFVGELIHEAVELAAPSSARLVKAMQDAHEATKESKLRFGPAKPHLEQEEHYDEQAMEGLAVDADNEWGKREAELREEYRARNEAVAKRIVNVLCHGTTCLISGRDEQVEQIVMSALQNELALKAPEPSPQCSECANTKCATFRGNEGTGSECFRPKPEQTGGERIAYGDDHAVFARSLKRHEESIEEMKTTIARIDETSKRVSERSHALKHEWSLGMLGDVKARGVIVERIESLEQRLKAQDESITQMKNDLYPIEHPNRKPVGEGEGA